MSDNRFYFRSLNPRDLNEMYFAFLDAFADYPVPFRLNKEQFVRKFVEKLKIDFSLSIGAFDYDALGGFIFTSTNRYHKKLTAYNGGTGVRPPYRGNDLTFKMYDFLIPRLREKGIKQCVLEVLINNIAAIKVYEKIGFKRGDILHCYKIRSGSLAEKVQLNELEIVKIYQPNLLQYEAFQDFQPSFLDSFGMITENMANEEVIEARLKDETVGYAIYQPAFGRLSQMAVKQTLRRKGIGYSLMSYIISKSNISEITVINVNENDKAMHHFLMNLGFENQISQYEMLLPV